MSSSLACVFVLGFTAAVGAQRIECRAAGCGIDPQQPAAAR
jgi:hypothetical protein